jgi:hypothetical protein
VAPASTNRRPDYARVVAWDDDQLQRIWRVRLRSPSLGVGVMGRPSDLGNRGQRPVEVLDGEGELRDGQRVTVRFPFRFLLADILMVEVLAHARQWQVYAKGLGLLDPAIYGS